MVAVTVAVTMALALTGTGPAAAGGGCHAESMTDAAARAVDMSERCFSPVVARIDVGETVTWTNRDTVAHAVTGAGQSFGGYDAVDAGATTAARFERAGIFPYFCVLHPSMIGVIVVGDGGAGAGRGEIALSAARIPGGADAGADAPASGAPSRALDSAPWLALGLLAGVGATLGAARLRRRA
jgi:plastocyanin